MGDEREIVEGEIEELPCWSEVLTYEDICKICPKEAKILNKVIKKENTHIDDVLVNYVYGQEFTKPMLTSFNRLVSAFIETTSLQVQVLLRTVEGDDEGVFCVRDIYEKTKEALELEVKLGHDIPTEGWIEFTELED